MRREGSVDVDSVEIEDKLGELDGSSGTCESVGRTFVWGTSLPKGFSETGPPNFIFSISSPSIW